MAEKVAPGPLAGVHVLVVDDAEESCAVMRVTLEYAGALVIAVNSARAAYEALSHVTFDIMVVDLRMPGEDGPAFAQAVQRVPLLRTIPLLAVTAYHELYDRDALRAAGFVQVLRKPFVVPDLVQAIERIVAAKPDRYADSNAETAEDLPLVLIVDDNDDHRVMLALYVRSAGFRVIEAIDGTSAVGKARRLRPNVILLDLNLPGLKGWQACQWLKSSLDTASIPVIAITGYDPERAEREATAAGCDRFIVKGTEPERVVQVIRDVLGSR
jgi:CheY-like chemotaxis protein